MEIGCRQNFLRWTLWERQKKWNSVRKYQCNNFNTGKSKQWNKKIIFLVLSYHNLTKMKQIWKRNATIGVTYSQTRLNSKCTKLKNKNRQNTRKIASIKEHHQYENVHCDNYSKDLHYEGNTKKLVQRLSEKVDFLIFLT